MGKEDVYFRLQIDKDDTKERRAYRKLIEQLARNYEKLLQGQQDKLKETTDFIENWVHEIKTPIAAAKLIIESG